MIVVDTSAWVELLRRSGSAVHLELRRLLASSAEIAVTEVVVMEVLAGARDTRQLRELHSRLLAFPLLRLRGLRSFEAAAELARLCRAAGETVRRTSDCLIAVPAIEAGATLLHADRDFEKLARHTSLRLHQLE